MTNSMPLGTKGAKRIIRTLARTSGWEVRAAPGRNGWLCMGPNGKSVAFGRNSAQANVFAEFRRAGLEVDPRRTTHTNIKAGQRDVNHAFASLAFLLDEMVAQKPLIDVPESVMRSYTWTDHAFDRIEERNIGVFEVVAALHQPDHVIPDDNPDYVHYMRGDVEVIVETNPDGQPRVVTVLDMLNNRRGGTPRVALAPELVPAAATSAPPIPDPDPAPACVPEEVIVMPTPRPEPESKYQRVRAAIDAYAVGATFTTAQIIEAAGSDATNVVYTTLSKDVSLGVVERLATGTYRVAARPEVKELSPEHRAALDKAHAARRGEVETTEELVLRRIRLYGQTTDFTLNSMMAELGDAVSSTGVRRVLRRLVADGTLVQKAVGTTHELHYRKAPKKRTPAAPKPEESTVVFRAPVPSPRPAPTHDDEDYEVSTGFAFVAALPKSDLYDLIDSLVAHRSEMERHPGAWAQFATYAGGRAHEIAEKRAAAIENELKDGGFRFQVRRLSATEVGLYASYHPVAG